MLSQGTEAALGATSDRNGPRILSLQRSARGTSANGRPRAAARGGAGPRGDGGAVARRPVRELPRRWDQAAGCVSDPCGVMRGFETAPSHLPWPRALTAGTRCPRRGRVRAAIHRAGTGTRAASRAAAVAKISCDSHEYSPRWSRNGSRRKGARDELNTRTHSACCWRRMTRRPASMLLLCV